jgi:hypothetical protein
MISEGRDDEENKKTVTELSKFYLPVFLEIKDDS